MKTNILIFPTDTVYGIGAKVNDQNSINKIYEIKGRNFNKPLVLLSNDFESFREYVMIDKRLVTLAKSFWPGALTLIVKTSESYRVKTGHETLGIRIPNHKLALKILKENGPMKVTSVNDSNDTPLNDYVTIKNKYGHYGFKIYKKSLDNMGVASTVLDLTGDLKILREGLIKLEEIKSVLKGENL